MNNKEEKTSCNKVGNVDLYNNGTVTLPYVASPERVQRICDFYEAIKPGMSPEQVILVLGKPDEINPLYDPQMGYFKRGAKKIGTTFFYNIRQDGDGRREITVRVNFDNEKKVTHIDTWGLEMVDRQKSRKLKLTGFASNTAVNGVVAKT